VLNFGLKFALEDIADKLSERNQNTTEVLADIQLDGEWTYPEVVEHHLYRIVQEASENALKYARAKTINISSKLYKDCIDITVQDDGIGFPSEIRLNLDEMLANKHFGLAGIFERANLIGAKINIDAKPQQGTSIHVVWMAKDSI
jgi:signal transduction histidine kinase